MGHSERNTKPTEQSEQLSCIKGNRETCSPKFTYTSRPDSKRAKTAKMKDFGASTAPKHTEPHVASANITQSVTQFSAYQREQKT